MGVLTAILDGIVWLFTSKLGRVLIGVALVLGLLWWAHATVWQRGYDAAQTDHAKALEAAKAAQIEAVKERDALAAQIAASTQAATEAAVTDVREETDTATERVRTVVRTVTVPATCPNAMPPAVNDELRDAVKRANGVRRG